MDLNAASFGVSIKKWMEIAGIGIAKIINQNLRAHKWARYKKNVYIVFFCGTGNNGGDGFAAAKHLFKKYQCKILLFGDPKDIKTSEAKFNWQRIKKLKIPYTIIKSPKNIKTDKSAHYFLNATVIVDCLIGTGIKGGLKEPIASAVKLFNKTKAKKVSVDFPTKGMKKVDIMVGMQFPKTADAKTVTLSTNKKFLSTIGPGEVKTLNLPKPGSHKKQNGNLLIIAGNDKYHGALLYAIKTASKIVDLIYVLTTKDNKKLIDRLKSKTAEFISIQHPINGHATSNLSELVPYLGTGQVYRQADCVLIGPGLGTSAEVKKLLEMVLKSGKKLVIDADGLNLLDKSLLKLINDKHILTPHKREFEKLFKLTPTPKNVERMSKKYNCTIVLKSKTDIVVSPKWGLKYNYTGNAGMTKGGTGDVLAGLIAGLYCTNDAYLAAAAGLYINGKAGDELYKKAGTFYNAEDLIKQIPISFKQIIDN